MSRFIVIVTGGRRYGETPYGICMDESPEWYAAAAKALAERNRLRGVLDHLHELQPISRLVHGACKTGADRWADQWALMVQPLPVTIGRYPADWQLGRKAGPLRNQQMIDTERPNLVVAFPGGNGTANCVALAINAGIKVVEVR